jgi:hypothetical protein
MRAHHGGLRPPRPRLRYTTWATLARVFSQGATALRSIRASIVGQRRALRYYPITRDVEEPPPESTWLIMTNLPGTIQKTGANTDGLRTGIAYGLKHSKNALGWADGR